MGESDMGRIVVKRFLNRAIVSAMAAGLFATMPVGMVYAEDITVSEDDIFYTQNDDLKVRKNYGLRPAKERVVHHDISPDDPALGAADATESKYVSPYYTEVINQGDTGCCWAIGNASALEANLKKKYDDELDFSWKNTAYYNYHKNDVSKNPDLNDYKEFIFRDSTFKEGPPMEEGYQYYGREKTEYIDCVGNNSAYLFAGGSSLSAPMLYSRGRCLKEEKGDDALSSDTTNLTNDFGNAGVAGSSASDAYRLKDIYIVSADRSNMDNLKAMIKEYGAGAISYNSYEEDWPYVYNTKSTVDDIRKEYADEYVVNHVVTIVGWDDTISASQFRSSTESEGGYGRGARGEQPAGDGAWVCINSWGTEDEVTDHGKTYISYYDESLKYGEVVFYDLYKKGDDSASGLWTDNSFAVESNDEPKAATDSLARGLAMKADEDVTLTSVSILTAEDNASYTMSVYGNPKVEDKSVSLTDNTPLLTQKVSVGMAGFHVINLDKAIGMNKGQTVFVILKPEKSVKNYYSKKETNTDEEADWMDNLYLGHRSCVSDASGMSLVEKNGSLVKMSDGDVYLQLFSNDGISEGTLTFEGSDFDMGSLDSGSASGTESGSDSRPGVVTGGSYSFESGSDRYEISWTDSVPYTGCPHTAYGIRKKNATPDVKVVVKKNGQEINSSEYKLKFKNNKFISGYKGKSPELYVKLSKSCGKEAAKALKKVPLGFEIRKCDLSRDLDTSKFEVGTNSYGDKVRKLYDLFDKTTGNPVKLKLSKDGVKGDVIAEIYDSGRDTVTVTLRGINNCTGTVSDTFEVEWY